MVPIPLDLVTGFLGSGKTTLINALLRNPAFARTMVVVNEFGQVGLDHLLVTGSQDNVVLLDSGCLCCAISGTLRDTLIELFAGVSAGRLPAFNRLIVETSGLADPTPLMAGLLGDSALEKRCRLNQVLTLVDAVNAGANASVYPEVRRQIALADRLLVTKLDAPQAAGWAQMEQLLRALGGGAPAHAHRPGDDVLRHFALAPRQGAALDRLPAGAHGWLQRGPLRAQYGSADGPGALHGPGRTAITARTWRLHQAIDWPTYAQWSESLRSRFGKRLLRCKGLLALATEAGVQPWVVHGVQGYFAKPERLDAWPTPQPQGFVVCIGESIDAAELEAAMAPLGGLSNSRRAD